MSAPFTKLADLPRRSPLKQKTLADTIYEEVRGRLNRGEIGPEDRLLDYEIAAEFDCTRMPVRQALLRLVTESFLVATTRGFVVPRLDESDVREIFELRRILEPPAAASAALVLTDEALTQLRDAFDKTRLATERGDVAGVIQGNIEFRSAWLAPLKNRRLKATIQTFADHAQQVRLQTLRHPEALRDALTCLSALMDSFANRNAEGAGKAMMGILVSGERHYFAAHGLKAPTAN